MATLILIIFAAAVLWAAGVYKFPFRHCRKCGGTGRKPRRLNRGHHFDLCKRCDGTGRTQRPGSRLLHRAALSARTQLARELRQRRERKAAERAELPGRATYRRRSRL